ncbi:MAG: OmpH family outer membrane protein [Bacteroidota bacterium]
MDFNRKHYYALLGSILAALLLSIISFLTELYPHQKELVFIDNVKLYNNFHMVSDLSNENDPQLEKGKTKLDSLYAIYTIHKEQNNLKKAASLKSAIKEQDFGLRRLKESHAHQVSKVVWDRLNQYVKEYAEQKNYQIVFGTQGNGNIMFAESGIDITDDLLDYANSKYEGS